MLTLSQQLRRDSAAYDLNKARFYVKLDRMWAGYYAGMAKQTARETYDEVTEIQVDAVVEHLWNRAHRCT